MKLKLNERIKFFRKQNKLTQEKLSELLSCSIDTLQRWENGTREPRVSDISRLCEVFHCTEMELLSESLDDKCQLVVSWNWDDFKKGEINMNEEKFKLILGGDGKVGVSGAAMIKTREALEEFMTRIRSELEIAFETQVRRGVITAEA